MLPIARSCTSSASPRVLTMRLENIPEGRLSVKFCARLVLYNLRHRARVVVIPALFTNLWRTIVQLVRTSEPFCVEFVPAITEAGSTGLAFYFETGSR